MAFIWILVLLLCFEGAQGFLSPSSTSSGLLSSGSLVQMSTLEAPSANNVLSLSKPVGLTILDLPGVLELAFSEFSSACRNDLQRWELRKEIVGLFLPKFLAPAVMGHVLRGVKASDGRLLAFVDLSLQPVSGTLDALKPRTLLAREHAYGKKGLAPYLCNLLVAEEARKHGLGRLLVNECKVCHQTLALTLTLTLIQPQSPSQTNRHRRGG